MHPEDFLLTIIQDCRPIEDYVEEFFVWTEGVVSKERTLKTIFWDGLDDFLYHLMSTSYSSWSLGCYIEHALRLSNSSFTIDEIHDSPVDVQINQLLPAAKSMILQSVGKARWLPLTQASRPLLTQDTALPVPAPRQRRPVPTPCKRNLDAESAATITLSQDAESTTFSPRESSPLLTARSAVPWPKESSLLVTARRAIPSPGESSSQITARSVVPSPKESSLRVTARRAVPSPRESSSQITARSVVPSPKESSLLVMARSSVPSPGESSSQVTARSAVPSPGESSS